MKKDELHRLLKRQLKKSGLDKLDAEAMLPFLNMVNEAYKSFDKDLLHLEHILEESSKELFKTNQALKIESDTTKAKLEHIVNNVNGIIFQTDLNGNYKYLNKSWTKITGLPIEAGINTHYTDFLNDENSEEKERLSKLFLKKAEKYQTVFKYINSSAEEKWIELNVSLTTDNLGRPNGTIGTMTDVTALKEIEIKLHNASKAKDDFLSTMSHEIRTPLNAVTGLSNILLMEEYLPDQLENLQALKYSGEHLLGLINDILDLNKIQSGKLQLEEKEFSLPYVLESIESNFKLLAQEKNINFIIHKERDVPNVLIGDSLKLSQILKNLISNSIKFTDKGSVKLEIKNGGLEHNKISLVFKVIDTGIGIPLSKQKVIFESFMQAKTDTERKYGGTGLGLTISKKLLNMQNSNLEIESAPGRGATFWFNIQFKTSNRLNVFTPNLVNMQPSYKPLSINVLVAEDNKMNVLILKRFFKKWNVNFVVSENGKELLQIYENQNFDLILMDLQMPLLDGYEATSIIRQMPDQEKSKIPIIALTAFAQNDIKEKTEKFKMNGFMSKPFKPDELYKLLQFYSQSIS